jgi:hypothetical protein
LRDKLCYSVALCVTENQRTVTEVHGEVAEIHRDEHKDYFLYSDFFGILVNYIETYEGQKSNNSSGIFGCCDMPDIDSFAVFCGDSRIIGHNSISNWVYNRYMRNLVDLFYLAQD